MHQIPDEWMNPNEEDEFLYEAASTGGKPSVPPSMLEKIVEVMRNSEGSYSTAHSRVAK